MNKMVLNGRQRSRIMTLSGESANLTARTPVDLPPGHEKVEMVTEFRDKDSFYSWLEIYGEKIYYPVFSDVTPDHETEQEEPGLISIASSSLQEAMAFLSLEYYDAILNGRDDDDPDPKPADLSEDYPRRKTVYRAENMILHWNDSSRTESYRDFTDQYVITHRKK